MARHWSTDYLQSYPFWLVDIAPLSMLALPIFNPFMGFSSITGPEITFEHETIAEGNGVFDKKVIKRASAGPITLSRGVTWYDSDFWRWTMAALRGDMEELSGGIPGLQMGGPSYRRTMMLIHFFTRSITDPFPASDGRQSAVRAATLAAAVGVGEGVVSAAAVGGTAFALGAGLNLLGLGGSFEFAPRIPAKVYLLYGCIPSRYKLTGDLDARSSDISITELEMAVEMIEHKSFEFSPPVVATMAVAIHQGAKGYVGGG